MTSVDTLLGTPTIRRLLASWSLSLAAELAITVALSVHVYASGGAAALGVLGVARTLPGVVLTPLVTAWADRVRRERLLLATTVPRLALAALITIVLLADAPVWTVIVLGGLSAGLARQFRPLQAAMMPWLVRSPAELTAANGMSGIFEGIGVLAGPALAGAILVVGAPGHVLMATIVLQAATLMLLAGVRPLAGAIPASGTRPRPVRDWLAGMAVLRGPDALPLLVPALCQTFARGVLNVLVVPIAVVLFDLGDAGVGWLGAAMGVGGLVGGPLALAVVRSHRLGWLAGIAVIFWGIPLVVLAQVDAQPAAYLLFGAVGIANVLEDMSVFTALQRVLPPRVLGRGMGAFEVLLLTTGAIGSAVAPALLHLTGTRSVLLWVGLLLVVVPAAFMAPLVRLSRRIAVPAEETDLLRSLPFLDALPIGTVEHLAGALDDERFDAGDVVIGQGDNADRFYLLTKGSARALVGGQQVRVLSPGDYFGEIALLRDVPRTATVVASGPLEVRSLSRIEFLAAVTGNPDSIAAVDRVVSDRLASDPG